MEETLKELENVYYQLINTGEKTNLGQYYVLARGAIMKKHGISEDYTFSPPVFHSQTAEECLTKLAKYLKS